MCALTCYTLWALAFPFIKLGYQELEIYDLGSKILFAGIRFLLAGLLVLACFRTGKGEQPRLCSKTWLWLALFLW